MKSSLDSHSPRQTTNNIRLKTVKKRDQRIIETWKKEIEQPSVKEILENYKRNNHGHS